MHLPAPELAILNLSIHIACNMQHDHHLRECESNKVQLTFLERLITLPFFVMLVNFGEQGASQ